MSEHDGYVASGLGDLLDRYGAQLAQAAEERAAPALSSDDLPDLSDLNQYRSIQANKRFAYFPSQREKIGGLVYVLRKYRRAMAVMGCGTGKTPSSLAASHVLFKGNELFDGRPFIALVMSPGHIVEKWQREARQTIPGADVRIVRNLHQMMAFHRVVKEQRPVKRPYIVICSKEALKLGMLTDVPVCTERRVLQRVKVHAPLPTDRSVRMLFKTASISREEWATMPHYEVARTSIVAACPNCLTRIKSMDGGYETRETYLSGPRRKCPACGEWMSTHAATRQYKHQRLDTYIQRHMRGVFDLLIADEVHELSGEDTAQGTALAHLASACRYTIGLTGTLINGKASSIYSILWRMWPDLMRARGFRFGDGERAFCERYGVLQHELVRDLSGTTAARPEKTGRRVRAGISPDLFNHFLIGRSVFMELEELGQALPPITRELVPCTAGPALAGAYADLDEALVKAIKAPHSGKGPPTLATTRILALDSYLDQPWGYPDINEPVYDDEGNKVGLKFVVRPKDLDEHYGSKDEALLRIIQSELAVGRKCCIYCQYTDPIAGKRNVRNKLLYFLDANSINARVLPDTVAPDKREEWLAVHAHEFDVLIVHPKRVQTGLDLIDFPTIIWYQIGYSCHVMRQASARARRPIQTQPCKVFFLYYRGTVQEHALALMGDAEAASQALEGKFDVNAMNVMLNGADDDSILSSLARRLDASGLDAQSSWRKVA